MMVKFATLIAATSLALAPAFVGAQTQPAAAGGAAVPTEMKDAISGTMDIQFNTRTNLDSSGDLRAGSAAVGAVDKYDVNLTVAQTSQFSGEVNRQPNLYTNVLGRKKQDAKLTFDLNLIVLNPNNLSQKRTVGKWVGVVPIDTNTGAFILQGDVKDDRPLRIAVDTMGAAQGFQDKFDGKLIGKAEKKEGLTSYTYKRIVGGKEVTKTVQRVDPMRFESITLAKGPANSYPRTTVNGRLDYDYETGNYLTDGIKFSYTADGKEVTDTVTGTIKWVEDANRASNGKGQYEFNLRWNEEANTPASGEAAAFAPDASEDAFFAVDNSVPSLTGTVEYVDQMSGETVTGSKVTYHLNANKLTKQQVMAFAKLWILAVGPTNDE
ncbi:MAG TPA: hypothetical protein VGN72_20405 [Tepidisphaeraceae bacterium]|jgi:hypothetical protein|nr:hypothetical protein [Tepidisphaeraceae bacterium]